MRLLIIKKPRHIPHTSIPFPQQRRLANFRQRAGFAAFAVVGRWGLSAMLEVRARQRWWRVCIPRVSDDLFLCPLPPNPTRR